MPELPEVETMCRGIQPVVGGHVDRVEFCRTRLKPIVVQPHRTAFRRRLVGRTINRVERLGKRIVIQFDNGLAQVIEPRMTGLVLLSSPPDEPYLRVGWHLSNCGASAFWFWDRRGLGTLCLLSQDELRQRLGPERLGPDALLLRTGELRDRLRASRRAVKVALLDQRVVAGIGNLYASEILHVAGVHPAKRCTRLKHCEWQQVESATQQVLEEAVHYEGSTLSDGTYRNALNQSGSYQNHHRVYARAGDPCVTCGEPIHRTVQAQRSTFWCRVCQKR